MIIYLIGSLRNPHISRVAGALRDKGYEVFDDWFAGGEKADEEWMAYEKSRGRTYWDALNGHAANHTFNYDKAHLDRADCCVLVSPAGKSAHLELGYMVGKGKPGFIYMEDEPERWDVMVKFATGIVNTFDKLVEALENADAVRRTGGLPNYSWKHITPKPCIVVGPGGSGSSGPSRVFVSSDTGRVPTEPVVHRPLTDPAVMVPLQCDPSARHNAG